jgi:hypothetical protein
MPANIRSKTGSTLHKRKIPAITPGFVALESVVTSRCQTLPASAGHSHSIINKPFFVFILNDLFSF